MDNIVRVRTKSAAAPDLVRVRTVRVRIILPPSVYLFIICFLFVYYLFIIYY